MTQDRDTPGTAELERRVKEAAEAFPEMVALAYTDPTYSGCGLIVVLVVAEDVARGVQRLLRSYGGMRVEFLSVDRGLFESDVKASTLLEVAAGRLLLPYVALAGVDYLSLWDRIYKRRKIEESLSALVFDHPELSSELLIDPKYFVHDTLTRLSHILPQASELLYTLGETGQTLIEAYHDSLRDIERAETIHISGGLVSVDRGFVDATLRRGVSVSDQLTRAQMQLQTVLKLGLRGAVDLLRPMLGFSIVEGMLSTSFGASELPRPDHFLHFPTATGFSSLSESTPIEGMLTALEPSTSVSDARLRRFGGVLNEVYLLTYTADRETRMAIVKRYPNWVSLKWAPLALWTLGTQNFAVLGRSRMERECATTSLLSRSGITVPRILHTSFKDRMLLREYVEGENLADIVKAVIRKGDLRDPEEVILRRVGWTVSAVHDAGATLGDCKPENFIIKAGGEPIVVDLEQGARGGNESWDLAEFLYFSGHYAGPLDPLTGVTEVARCFIEGYINGGGSRRRVSEVARLRYTKVFAPITLPQVIYTITKTCRRVVGKTVDSR